MMLQKKTKEHNPSWPEIPDHPYRILIIGGSESGKTNSLFNLVNQQPDNDKIYFKNCNSIYFKIYFIYLC